MLLQAEHTVLIHRPVAEVFALVADPTQEPRWNPAVLKTEQLSRQHTGVGTVYQETHHVIFRSHTVTFEVSDYQPDGLVGFKSSSGPVQTHMLYMFQPQTEGTQVTLKGEAEVSGFLRILAPLLRRTTKEQVVKTLGQLKEFLERE
jgi:uncharacterized protein YndB with AHSA1/START domain